MQLGMIGLGRMGANMVRRLLQGGHECVVFDTVAAGGRRRWSKEKATGADVARGLRRASSRKPRAVWLMVPAAVVDKTIADLAAASRAGRHPHRRRQFLLRRRHPPREGARAEGHPLRRRRHERRRLGPGARLLHDDRRRGRRSCSISIRSSRTLAPGMRRHRAHAGPREGRRHRRAGLPALRPERRRPLRQDGPQRHRVRHDGRVRRRAGHPARRQRRQAARTTIDAETTPLRDPEHYQYDLNLPDIAEVWRRGSVIASWLLDLTAAALLEDPTLAKFAGRVSDSGEGRWTIKAAIDEGVPAPVLTTALYERFSSRGEADFQNKLLSAMRYRVRRASRKAGGQVTRAGARHHERDPFRRTRLLRRHRRPRVQEDLPGAAGDGQARAPRRAGHRRGQGRLEPRPASAPGPATASKSTAASIRGVRQARAACCATSTATTHDPATFPALRQRTRRRAAPGALPRDSAGAVRHGRRAARASRAAPSGARVIVEKPFGRDLASAQRAQPDPARHLRRGRTSSASTITSASGRCTTCCSSASPTRSSSRSGTASYVESVQITMAEDFGVQGRGAFYDQTGTIRDVIQNHLFQVLANLAMEPPVAHRQRIDPRREGEGAEGDPAARRERPRARPVPRLPRRAGRRARFEDARPSRRCKLAHRFLALAGRARSTSAPASACR